MSHKRPNIVRNQDEFVVEARYGAGRNAQTLYADCPICGHKNNDNYDTDSHCEHYVETRGGCGAYTFVFLTE